MDALRTSLSWAGLRHLVSMASKDDRVPLQSTGAGSGDTGDGRRLHPISGNSIYHDGDSQRPRGSSSTSQDPYHLESSRFQQARQPINDAITSAFNSNATSAASFHPDLLQQITSQITANVLQQLKAANLSVPDQQAQMSGSHMDAASSTAGSPPLDRATVYTPPSPFRPSEDISLSQPSPQFPPPPPTNLSSFRAASPVVEKRAASPFSQSSHLSESEGPRERQSRPKGPKRISTNGDATILERVWGTLFNEQGQATPRLGQFLRGIATHLIEDYEPKNSLVITPNKIQRYYEETKLTNEIYPWKIIFDDRTSSISRMFREIGAQHHLVQENLNERPDIPGLTPQGFETWATLLLKAHPDQEFERLARTALDMPISNPDEKKERFPKELSRRLFPTRPDFDIVDKLHKVMSAHCNVNFASLQGSTAESTPRPAQSNKPSEDPTQKMNVRPSTEKQDPVAAPSQPSPALSHVGLERQRQPYSGGPSDDADVAIEEDTEDTPTPQPIERERKPYVAAPGGGKTYDHVDKSTAGADMKPPPPPHEIKLGRSSSVHATGRANDFSRSNTIPIAIHQRPPPPPMDLPESRHHRANSSYHRDQQPRSGRNRSPSMGKDNGGSSYVRRPESDLLYSSPPHHSYAANEQFDDARRHREYELQRERLANDRYDAARMAAYDPRERERERDRDNRPRMQPVSAYDGPASARGPPASSASVLSADEDYYRDRAHTPSTTSYTTPVSISTGFQPPSTSGIRESSSIPRDPAYGSYPSTAAYPPNSYRDMR